MKFEFLDPAAVSPTTEEQIKKLFAQLSPLPATSVSSFLSQTDTISIAICTENEQIIGMATMVVYQLISGRKAWIEDVVVHSEYRQKGIAETLMKMLIDKSNSLNISALMLYSNPAREAAHRLYQKLGFVVKGSTLFVFSPEKK